MMKIRRPWAIAVMASIAGALIVSTALGQRLAATNSVGIFDYEVTNDDGILFADEFERLGGVDTLGYPASYRFRSNRWDGFTYQLTQGALLQWHPAVSKVYLVNIFDWIEPCRLLARGIPMPIRNDGSGGDWDKAREIRLSWLTNQRIKEKYLANPNPEKIEFLERRSSDRAIRAADVLSGETRTVHKPAVFQRVALQLWVEEVEGMPAPGTVVRVLGRGPAEGSRA